MLSLKGKSCLQVVFVLIWMKQTLIWFNLQRDGTGDTFAESLQLQMSVLHQSMSICHSSRVVSQVHMMAGQNVKKEYLMCQIPIRMLRQHGTPNSRLHNFKIYSSKGCAKKLVKDELYVCSYNCQQKISLQIIGFCFDLWILLLLTLTSITQFVTK